MSNCHSMRCRCACVRLRKPTSQMQMGAENISQENFVRRPIGRGSGGGGRVVERAQSVYTRTSS
eukprot:scaffold72937_cov38-Tisochrysis_lutea.AAC.3